MSTRDLPPPAVRAERYVEQENYNRERARAIMQETYEWAGYNILEASLKSYDALENLSDADIGTLLSLQLDESFDRVGEDEWPE